MIRLIIFFVPLLLMIAAGMFGGVLVQGLAPGYLRMLVNGGFGLAVAVVMWRLLIAIFRKAQFKSPKLGQARDFAMGCAVGLAVSAFSGLLYAWSNGLEVFWNEAWPNLGHAFLGSIFSAFNEEIVFRGGMVEATLQMFGKTPALAVGAIPFGLIHLLSLLMGVTVTAGQIFGIIVAGLLLTLSYLRWGLLGAIGIHWMWNSLVVCWVYELRLNPQSGVSDLEGTWTTCLVLAITSGLTYWHSPRVK